MASDVAGVTSSTTVVDREGASSEASDLLLRALRRLRGQDFSPPEPDLLTAAVKLSGATAAVGWEAVSDALWARVAQLEFLAGRGKLGKEVCFRFILQHPEQLADYAVSQLWSDPLVSHKWTLVAVRKPFNMLVHGKDHSFEGERTVASWFASAHPDVSMYPCHTLQDDMSGVMLLGTSKSVCQSCKLLFDEEKVKKTYHALVLGHPDWPEETRLDFPARGGRPITFVRVLRRGWWAPGSCPASLVESWTMSGRAHQIETHLRKAGYPIVGECQHGQPTAYRLFLNLSQLDVPLVHHAEPVTIVAPHGFGEQLEEMPSDGEIAIAAQARSAPCQPSIQDALESALHRWGASAHVELAADLRSRSSTGSVQEVASEDIRARLAQMEFLEESGWLAGADCLRMVTSFPDCLASHGITEVWRQGDLVVVNKPFNRLIYPKKRLPRDVSIAEWLAGEAAPGPLRDARPCHRLDYGTSGALLLACSKEEAQRCTELFASRRVNKRYHALVLGHPPWDEEVCLDGPIDGKPSETFVRVVKRGRWAASPEPHVAREAALVEARPTTGRTHQIRLHLSGAGYPIVGDLEYGGCPQNDKAFAFRTFLHSSTIEFPLLDGSVSVEVPHDFEQRLT